MVRAIRVGLQKRSAFSRVAPRIKERRSSQRNTLTASHTHAITFTSPRTGCFMVAVNARKSRGFRWLDLSTGVDTLNFGADKISVHGPSDTATLRSSARVEPTTLDSQSLSARTVYLTTTGFRSTARDGSSGLSSGTIWMVAIIE
jgi:hypothetical protein